MTKYTSTLTITTLCLLFTKANIAGPILIEEHSVSSPAFSNSSNDETNQLSMPHTKWDLVDLSEDKNQSTERAYDISLTTSSSPTSDLYSSFTDDSQANMASDYENLRNEILIDLLDNQSILDDYDFDDYDFSNYQESLKALIDGKHLIPMKLISWKDNIDNMVYENSGSLSSNYYISDFEQRKNTNKKSRQTQTSTPSAWALFYHSKYYTWVRNTLIVIVLLIIFKDVFRSINLKKSNSPRNSRYSNERRR